MVTSGSQSRLLQPAENLWGGDQDWESGTNLSFSLSTSRMKFQEDPNTDSSPEADAEKSSGATEGKGLRRSPFFAVSVPCHNLPSPLLCPSPQLSPLQFTSRCGEWWDGVCGPSGHRASLEPEKAVGSGLWQPALAWLSPRGSLSPSQGPVPMPWPGRERQPPACWRCSKIWTEPMKSSSSGSSRRQPWAPLGTEEMPEPAWKEVEGASGPFSVHPGPLRLSCTSLML